MYPPYSPDLTFCNFYIFGYVKESLTGREFADREELFATVTSILNGIKKMTLEQVFLTWMNCLARCNATNREYIE
jgi:hypothetical protein